MMMGLAASASMRRRGEEGSSVALLLFQGSLTVTEHNTTHSHFKTKLGTLSPSLCLYSELADHLQIAVRY